MSGININKFDFNLLRALHILLRERNVTRSAEELHVTQQAMSGSLKRLRDHFGDEILTRVGNHLEPTPLGVALVEPVRDAILQIGLALDTVPKFSPELTRRHFRIAMSDYASLILLPHLAAYLADRVNHITYDIRPLSRNSFYDLDHGELDFCIMPKSLQFYQDAASVSLHTVGLYDDDFVCVVDEGNNSVGASLTKDEYQRMRHTTVHFVGGLRSLVEDSWAANKISPPIAATASSFASLILMILGTPYIATVHRRIAKKFQRMLPIRILECPFEIEVLNQTLIWHARYENDPSHHFMRNAFIAGSKEI